MSGEPTDLKGRGGAVREASKIINASEQWFLIGISVEGSATVVSCMIEPADMLIVIEDLAEQLRALLEKEG